MSVAPAARSTVTDTGETWQDRIDRVCDWFEQAWHAGAGPAIEDYLQDESVPAARRAALFRDLLEIERQRRERRDDHPKASDYLDRFPSYRTISAPSSATIGSANTT
jgi:hypothetical protein